MRDAFHRPDYQELLMCPLIKRLGQAFVLKHAAEPLKRSVKLLRVYKKTKSSAECLKSSTACLYHNTAHAIPTSHGIRNHNRLVRKRTLNHLAKLALAYKSSPIQLYILQV